MPVVSENESVQEICLGQIKEWDGHPMNRAEFEHVKSFLHRIESYISPISMRLAVRESENPEANRGWGRHAFHKIEKLIKDAWTSAATATPPEERFASLLDYTFMKDAIRQHFEPILIGYGLTRELAKEALEDFEHDERALTRVLEHGSLHSRFPLCGHTESEEMALDNLMSISSLGHAHVGRYMSMISEDCIKSIMNALASGSAPVGEGEHDRVMTLLGARMIQLGHPVPEGVFRMIMSKPADVIVDAIFQFDSTGFSIKNLSGAARRQFSELLSVASTSPEAAMFLPIQFDGQISEEDVDMMAENARQGKMTYI
jgi:hypothetical protein